MHTTMTSLSTTPTLPGLGGLCLPQLPHPCPAFHSSLGGQPEQKSSLILQLEQLLKTARQGPNFPGSSNKTDW